MLKLTQCPNPSVRFDRATHASTPMDTVDTGTHLRSALVWLWRTRLVHSHSSFFSPFLAPCRLSTLALAPVPDPSFFFFWFLPPLKLAQGAHHGRRSPHLVTRQCFSSTPPPLPCCLGAADLATFTPHPCNQQSAQQAACKLKPRTPPVATHPCSFSRTLVP